MSLMVAMPLKLRLDLRAAREGQDRLDAAVRAAYARAAAATGDALEDRGDYLAFDLQAPRFVWSGDGLRQLGLAERAAAEAVIESAIHSSVIGGLDRPSSCDVPEPLQYGEGAAPDPDRMLPGSYLAPSYDTNPDKPKDQIVFAVDPGGFYSQVKPGYKPSLYQYTTMAALEEASRTVLRSAVKQNRSPRNSQIGVLYQDRSAAGNAYWIGLARYAGNIDELTIYDRFVLGGDIEFFKGSKIDKPEVVSLSLTGVGRYSKVGSGSDAELSLATLYVAEEMQRIEQIIIEKKLNQTDADMLRKNAEAAFKAQISAVIANAKLTNPGRKLTHVRFTDGASNAADGVCPDVFDGQTEIEIYPIIRPFYDPKEEENGEGGGAGGRGKTAKGKGGAGDGAEGSGDGGEGGGDGGEGEDTNPPGGGSEEGDEAGTSARFVFPQGPNGEPVEIDLGPLNAELSFDELGDIGHRLRALMQRIAFRLSMPEGKYPGSFLVAAAKVWGARAAGASGFEGVRAATLSELAPAADGSFAAQFTGPSAAGQAAALAPIVRKATGQGTLGDVDFQPADSPVLSTLRHLGGTVPTMTALSRGLWDAYQIRANAARLGSYYTDDGVAWHLHFLYEYSPAIRESIAYGFKVACKSCLIQLCLSSRHEILLRRNNFDRYAPLVETLLVQMVQPQAGLTLLRKALMDWTNENRRTTESTIASGFATWRQARQALTASMDPDGSAAYLEKSKTSIGVAWTEAKVELGIDDVPRVRDMHGRLWTLAELDQAIALGTGTAQAIDPLVRKIADLPQAAVIAKSDPTMLRGYLKALLNEMLTGNTKITSEAEGPAEFAFRASKINEDVKNASVPGTSVVLGGLHLLAHQEIGASFMGDARYAEGLDHAFSVELGRQGLIAFFEFTGVMFLSVVCPPLGAVAGAIVAEVHLDAAQEKMEMLKGLMDESKVMSLADAELDLFLAELETVFAFIPLAGKALKFGAKGGVAMIKSGAKAGAKKAFSGLAKEVAEEMAAQLKHGLVIAFMKELASDQVVGKLVESAIEPAIKALMNEISLTVGTGTVPGTSAADEAIAKTNMQRLLNEEGSSEKARSEGAEIARKGTF